ncbi:hypothetical protein C922_00680 [Plasmodium inui San Antonio 1]|uniref:peptidylprolyl isomerase n=1 Tax=Plasmodium inui San Antonio 1 TaxID=1237626 RepID=W7AIX4_9APIC|nr:hypothetical protein C922_00680 [Plasmodium inui San Antonio 1]EUD68989.1 hypothetical protein C922_00680 [Plasmodium inui San Antonio 1]
MDALPKSSTQSSLNNLNQGNDKYDQAKGAENNHNENVDTYVCDESEKNELSKSSPSENDMTKENQDSNANAKEEKDKEEKTVINDCPPDGEDKPKKLSNDSIDEKFSEDQNEKETRDDANAKYTYGDYEGAIKIWLRGLRSINYVLSKKEELSSERLESFQKLHAIYCSNIAQGFMRLSKFSDCVKYSLMAQENDKKNVKVYFRLAKGYFMLGEYDKSIQVLNEGIEIDNNTALVNLLALVKKKKETFLKKEKHMMKYIFDNLKDTPLIHDKNCSNSIFRAVYSLISLLLMFVYAFFVRSSSLLARIFKKWKVKSV